MLSKYLNMNFSKTPKKKSLFPYYTLENTKARETHQ